MAKGGKLKRYQDHVRIIPTNITVSIADYSAQILKHMPAKALDTIKEILFYDKQVVSLPADRQRRLNNSTTAGIDQTKIYEAE